MGSINGVAGSLPQQTILQSTGLTGDTTISAAGAIFGASDNNHISPLAKVLGELQTLQQTDPAKYKEVTGKIALQLQSAAQADTAAGNTAGADQLSKLAADFSTASTSGQLPNLQDLAQSIGGEHHHHHGHGGHSHSSDPDSSPASISAASSTSSATTIQTAYQNGSSQTSTTKPLAILLTTLSS